MLHRALPFVVVSLIAMGSCQSSEPARPEPARVSETKEASGADQLQLLKAELEEFGSREASPELLRELFQWPAARSLSELPDDQFRALSSDFQRQLVASYSELASQTDDPQVLFGLQLEMSEALRSLQDARMQARRAPRTATARSRSPRGSSRGGRYVEAKADESQAATASSMRAAQASKAKAGGLSSREQKHAIGKGRIDVEAYLAAAGGPTAVQPDQEEVALALLRSLVRGGAKWYDARAVTVTSERAILPGIAKTELVRFGPQSIAGISVLDRESGPRVHCRYTSKVEITSFLGTGTSPADRDPLSGLMNAMNPGSVEERVFVLTSEGWLVPELTQQLEEMDAKGRETRADAKSLMDLILRFGEK